MATPASDESRPRVRSVLVTASRSWISTKRVRGSAASGTNTRVGEKALPPLARSVRVLERIEAKTADGYAAELRAASGAKR